MTLPGSLLKTDTIISHLVLFQLNWFYETRSNAIYKVRNRRFWSRLEIEGFTDFGHMRLGRAQSKSREIFFFF